MNKGVPLILVLKCIILISYVRTLLEVPDIKMPGVSIVGYMLICKKTVTNLLKVSDLKMPGALIVVNTIICNKIVNKESLRAMVFLNINQKEGLGFQRCAANVARAAIGLMSVGPRESSKVISCYQEANGGHSVGTCS